MSSAFKTELLAPAKNKETAFEAINCGADAVYIGAASFGARHNACNSLNDIQEVVNYAHKFWAKVYVTVNTILTDEELDEAVELVKDLDRIGVDAVLIQDMGLLNRLIKLQQPHTHSSDSLNVQPAKYIYPPLHASTQCDNRDLEKVSFLYRIGLSRVVLARELSLGQIKEIHDANPDLELEAFVHGSLCVSFSGQCYLSEFIGGRSANRGECAQPCRKKYRVFDTEGKEYIYPYALCLKDFNASAHIKEMIESGVYSFKIEGRLKDVGYVKNVVSYYRQLLDKYSKKSSSGKSIYPFTPDLEKSFNRGFTDYFLKGRTDCFNPISPKSRGKLTGKVISAKNNALLVDTKTDIYPHDIYPQDGLCFINNNDLEGFLVNKVEKTKDGILIYPNRKINIKSGTELYRNLDVQFEKELLMPVKRQIGVGVNIFDNKIELKDEDNISITLELPSGEQANNQEKMNETFIKQFSKTGKSDFYIESININSDIPFMPVSAINQFRRECFEKLMEKRLASYKREEPKELSYTDISSVSSFTPDYRANVHNKEAKDFYKRCGCNIKEWSLESKNPNRQVELMRTKHCIKYALNMCKSPKNLILQDEKGVQYPLKFDCNKCEMSVMSPKPDNTVY